MGIVVAIDGPSGSGKSTVSRRVAAELGLCDVPGRRLVVRARGGRLGR